MYKDEKGETYMLKRYHINKLFLASITVQYPDNEIMWDINIGGMLQMGFTGYGYVTVVRKQDDHYIDLKNESKKITTTHDPSTISYSIGYMQPFSKYYEGKGRKKVTFTKQRALKEAERYYAIFHQEISSAKQE